MSPDLKQTGTALSYCQDCFYKKDGLCHHADLQVSFADQSGRHDPLPQASGAEISAMLVEACQAGQMKVVEQKDAVDRQLENVADSLRAAGFGLVSFIRTGAKQ